MFITGGTRGVCPCGIILTCQQLLFKAIAALFAVDIKKSRGKLPRLFQLFMTG
jgi:hypothetical protein